MKLSALDTRRGFAARDREAIAASQGSAVSDQRSAARLDSSFIPHPSSFRGAFTLTELLVSLVILVGMMTLIATIFSTASKSSGQAQAQTRLQRHVRQASETIREDLPKTLPGLEASGAPKGVLAIAGSRVDAYDTRKSGQEVHYADILMLITQQRFEPFIYETPTGARSPTIFEGYKQVVYGHADIGKIDPATGQWFPKVKLVENGALGLGSNGQPQSDMLASEWHLARRSIGFVRSADLTAPDQNLRLWPLTSAQFLGTVGSATKMTDAALALRPDNTILPFSEIMSRTMPGFYSYERQTGGIAPLESFFTNPDGAYTYVGNRNPSLFYLYNSYWWQFNGSPAAGQYTWLRFDPRLPDLDPPGLNVEVTLTPSMWPPFYVGYLRRLPVVAADPFHAYRFWPAWFCSEPDPNVNSADLYRTRLDPMPPAGMPERTSAYFLPACAEFKVEFTYDDPREIPHASGQLMLADTNGDGHIGPPYTTGIPDAPLRSPINWQSVPPGQIYVWTGLDVDPKVYPDIGSVKDPRNLTFPYRWPRALRITIRAYAPGGTLDYPIEQTLIHVW